MLCAVALAQEPAAKPPDSATPTDKAAAPKSEEKPALPFQIQLLETHIRFETNGDSRKEVHTIVKINDLAGARQFSRLGFDYNRAFQQVEIPLVKISHANGGTSEILPSAITDAPNPAVQDFPAYHDVRVKSVRILGLQDGDTIEYRVITATAKHPMSPHFWLEHTFDRSGIVSREIFEVEMPASRARIRVNHDTPASTQKSGDGSSAMEVHRWDVQSSALKPRQADENASDILLTSFSSWGQLTRELSKIVYTGFVATIYAEATVLSRGRQAPTTPESLYRDVAANVRMVDLPFDIATNPIRGPEQILEARCGTERDKARLLDVLLTQTSAKSVVVAFSDVPDLESELPSPSLIKGIVLKVAVGQKEFFLDPGVEVAPFGVLPAKIRGRKVLEIGGMSTPDNGRFVTIPADLPFASAQEVAVNAGIARDGTLTARVKYRMRGDNELVLRLAFHQTPKERWKEVAGLLALSDGFRGTITNVTASDPMATKDPFTVEYEITLPKFVDWTKKPVRIPALLPQIALPDLPGKTAEKIELGTPLDVQTSLTLKLPEGTTVQTPAATSVARDYATFASKYDGHLNTVNVSRHINFLKRDIPSDRATDYNAFLRAVQNDQAQMLVLLPAAAATTP